jgi:Glycosyl hydrolase family 76
MRIRTVGVVFAAAMIVALMPVAQTPASGQGRGSVDSARAIASYRALQRYLAVPDGSGLYRERFPVAAGDNPYSYEWPFSQVHAATLDLTGLSGRTGADFRPDLAARDAGQQRYWSSAGTTGVPGYASYPEAPYGSGGDFFYDDNEWVGLLDVQRYLMFGDRAALRRAEQLFTLVRSGWDDDSGHADAGGVFWTQAGWSTDRNTVSNMPAAELGLRLYQITGRRSYLDFSIRMYEWTNRYLLGSDGLYWDHLDLSGTVEKTYWSYNQGVPVGVNVLLYQITHDRTYLRRAERLARAAGDYFGAADRLAAQPPSFNAIFFKNLLLLESVAGGHTYRDAMARYAATTWSRNRDPDTGLFHFAGGPTESLQQAAMVQIYAVLAWNPSQYALLY